MHREWKQLFDEAILLEMNAAQLYDIFRWEFPEDAFFWAKLSIEERNQAALLEAGRDNFNSLNCFSEDLPATAVAEIMEINEKVSFLIQQYNEKPPLREEAFNCALFLEKSADELRSRHFVTDKKMETLDRFFQKMNVENKNHSERILEFMMENDIKIQKIKCDNLP